jgi:hypothetical protein
MLIKEKVLEEIEGLSPQQLFVVYSLISALKSKKANAEDPDEERGYLKVQKALSRIKGNLSDYIIEDREDRV